MRPLEQPVAGGFLKASDETADGGLGQVEETARPKRRTGDHNRPKGLDLPQVNKILAQSAPSRTARRSRPVRLSGTEK